MFIVNELVSDPDGINEPLAPRGLDVFEAKDHMIGCPSQIWISVLKGVEAVEA